MMGMNLKLGFTGTRRGMTTDQSAELRRRLSSPLTNWSMLGEFHHGDCIGSDEEAHEMMQFLIKEHWNRGGSGVDIVVHPPIVERYRAYCQGDRVLPPRRYLTRDRNIVDSTDVLIACPGGMGEELRSGTWYTIRYARARLKPLVIVWRDGSVTGENWNNSFGERHNWSIDANTGIMERKESDGVL